MWPVVVGIAAVAGARWGPGVAVEGIAGMRRYQAAHSELLKEARGKTPTAVAGACTAHEEEAVPWGRLWQEFLRQDFYNHVFIVLATIISVALNLIAFMVPNYTGRQCKYPRFRC